MIFKLITIAFALLLVCCVAEDLSSCDDSLECVEKQLKVTVDELDTDSIGDWISVKKIGRTSRKIEGDEDFIERCVRFLREHELKIRVPESTDRSLETAIYDDTLKIHFIDSTTIRDTSNRIQNDLIKCTADVVVDHIKSEIKKAPFVPIALDETTDVAKLSQ
ncbi:unnamed protein product [Psylliodes chrysocephalus]|uniref:Uncharacterized protein n=1 Tax=Psylliodes chrysocephalus TaxID=3402493 RepID=A0A9P0GIN2_9CUCU|nr:unnamed protein product [Psylliodes chrysocephala]